jgi:ribosome maturation factor RimP
MTGESFREWAHARSLSCQEEKLSTIQADIEARLADAEPEVEVLLAEQVEGGTVRLYIDHPAGVTLDLCERVTHHLAELRTTHALEVSSPGEERPLAKPEHFRRFVGRRARVRTREPLHAREGEPRQQFTGELVGASEDEVTVAAGDGVVAIPYVQIQRSNLVGE